MASFNKVILMGNLTRDPEMRYTPKGSAVAKFGLAVNRKWRAESGEMREEVTFVDIEAWTQQAETIAKYCKKGSALLVEGRLRQDTWDDKQTGQKRSRLLVQCETFKFVGAPAGSRGNEGEPAPAPVAPPRAPAPSAPVAAAPAPVDDGPPVEDDDVPF